MEIGEEVYGTKVALGQLPLNFTGIPTNQFCGKFLKEAIGVGLIKGVACNCLASL
jgi:hypothetical protein